MVDLHSTTPCLLKVDIISARNGYLSFYEGIIMVEKEPANPPKPYLRRMDI
jgi:hypothetical protein